MPQSAQPNKPLTPASVLNKYFNDGSHGRPKVGMAEFKKELDQLDPDEKIELALDAGKELGIEVKVS